MLKAYCSHDKGAKGELHRSRLHGGRVRSLVDEDPHPHQVRNDVLVIEAHVSEDAVELGETYLLVRLGADDRVNQLGEVPLCHCLA